GSDVCSSDLRLIAQLIGASADEIALSTNTSYGLNIAALALPLERGDIVLVSDREFPANVYPWLHLRSRGIEVELLPVTDEGWPDEPRLLERIQDPRVRVLAVSLVQFSNGYAVDRIPFPGQRAQPARTSWWTPSRGWGRYRWTCGGHRWTFSRPAARSGCGRRGARDSPACAGSSSDNSSRRWPAGPPSREPTTSASLPATAPSSVIRHA